MELERKFRDVDGSLGLESIKASISEADMDKLWNLIENPYKNAIGSIVREYTSNCFDAHAEAKVKDAVRIKYGRDETGWYVSFIDVGTGMSPDIIKNIFMKVFASTKEKTNEMIGAWGMGSKSGLSYQDFFMIITHVNGTTYEYLYRKGEIRPTIDLVDQKQEKRRNGTEIRISIKDDEDLTKFLRETYAQLYYFENVVVDIQEILPHLPQTSWSNSLTQENVKDAFNQRYKLKKYNNFIMRFNHEDDTQSDLATSFERLHLVNGPVRYPLDTNNVSCMDIDTLQGKGIALKFDIGELDVIQTREDIRYTPKSIQAIKNKAAAAVHEIEQMYKAKYAAPIYDLINYMKLDKDGTSITLGEGEYTTRITLNTFKSGILNFAPFQKIDTNYNRLFYQYFLTDYYKHLGNLNIDNVPKLRYIKAQYSNPLREKLYHEYRLSVEHGKDYKPSQRASVVIVDSNDEVSIKKNKYLAFKKFAKDCEHHNPIFYKKKPLRNLLFYKKALNLHRVPKDKWRPLIIAYQKLEQEAIDVLIKHGFIIDYAKLKVDEKWWKEFQATHRQKAGARDTTKVSYMYRTKSYSGGDKWENAAETVNNIVSSRKLGIILSKDDKDKMLKLTDRFNRIPYYRSPLTKQDITPYKYTKARFMAFAPTVYDKIVKAREKADYTNIYTFEEFMKNKDDIKFKFLRELHVMYLMNTKYEDIRHFKDSLHDEYMEALSPKVYACYLPLKERAEQANSMLKIYNTGVESMYKTFFEDEYEQIAEHFEITQPEVIENARITSKFLYYFLPYLNGLGNRYNQEEFAIHRLAMYIELYECPDTKVMLNPELLSHYTEDEYSKLMVPDDGVNINSYDFLVKLKINMYEIKNKLKVTKFTL